MNKSIAHAEHNKKLSEQLYAEKKFLDWANTTAFYSALHFVSGKLLPGTYNNILCNNINDVYRVLRCASKHEATCELAKIGLPAIAYNYAFLMNSSFTARYSNYEVNVEQAKLCQKILKEIKDACI